MSGVRLIGLFTGLFIFTTNLQAQNFSPVSVTGFNWDVIAEAGPSSLATTTSDLDAAASNKVMYTNAFKTFAGISGGGLPDNGTIISGNMTFQLANYTTNNALLVYRNETANLDLVTTSSFAKLRILCFATEANTLTPPGALVNISLTFTDASTTSYISNYSLLDWFNGTINPVLSGFGRCSRVATAPWGDEAYPTNPRMYYIEIALNCTDLSKQLQRITFSNVTTAGNNAPFPNAVFLGVSGIPYSQIITPVITPSDCSGTNGSIALTVTGSSSPYTYSWNTSPVQTGATATGLAPGNYTCTITDAAGCITTYSGTVPLNNNAAMTASANPVAICPGASVQLNANVTTGPLTAFTWNPGNLSGPSVTVSPATTTTYTVNGSNAIGCTASAQVTVTVNAVPASPAANSITICSGASGVLQVQNPQAGFTYKWYDAGTGGTLLATGSSFTTPTLTTTTTYYVEAINTTGCLSTSRTAATVTVTSPPAAPSANGTTVCSGANATFSVINPQAGFTYNWYNVATSGATLGSGTSFTVNNVTINATYYVEAVSAGGCISNTRTAVTVSLLLRLPQPVVTLANTTFTSLTFSWTAIPGAIGYEITTDGGASFHSPSSGPSGTSHTISGLMGNTTVLFQVRALGATPCETSLLSVTVSGTTLSSKEIFVPNVFTPNGDGRNDILLVYGNYVASIQFRIFNQWGQLVFMSDNISNGWNGTFKGQQQPVGVYAYTLNVILQDGSIVNKKGSINLIR